VCQNLEKHPAEALREPKRRCTGREDGRLSPIHDSDVDSSLQSSAKRERGDETSAATAELLVRSQAKRLRATDFIDMGDDHYP
jgi:hypothetical protein